MYKQHTQIYILVNVVTKQCMINTALRPDFTFYRCGRTFLRIDNIKFYQKVKKIGIQFIKKYFVCFEILKSNRSKEDHAFKINLKKTRLILVQSV